MSERPPAETTGRNKPPMEKGSGNVISLKKTREEKVWRPHGARDTRGTTPAEGTPTIKKGGESAPPAADQESAANNEELEGIKKLIKALESFLRNAPADEREGVRETIKNNSRMPDTPTANEVRNILEEIGEKVSQMSLPPPLRDYSPAMYVRPIGEASKIATEAGILSLIGTNLLQALGVEVEPYSLAHMITYGASAGGVGFLNANTEMEILKSRAEGKGFLSTLRSGTMISRLLLYGASGIAAVGVAQETIKTTHQSERVVGGIEDPLVRFAEKRRVMKEHLEGFSQVPGKILEIAEKIETGKPTGEMKDTKQGQVEEYAQWSDVERKSMLDELRELFKNAGMDPGTVDRLEFNTPRNFGYGPAAKLKHALRTGEISDLPPLDTYDSNATSQLTALVGEKASTEEYVRAIREKMGLRGDMTLEARVREIVEQFFADPSFVDVGTHEQEALQKAAVIKEQADVTTTLRRSLLHGAAPLDVNAILSEAQAIIDARKHIDAAAERVLIEPIQDIFNTMGDALKVAGAPVEMVQPHIKFDISDIEDLSTFLQETLHEKASQTPNPAAASAVDSLWERFVPGGEKWKETKRWGAVQLLKAHGYRVELDGEETRISESVGTDQENQKWRELPIGRASDLLNTHETSAGWSGVAILGGGIGFLTVSILLAAAGPVRRLNEDLRKAVPEYVPRLLDEEVKLIRALQNSINDVLRSLPVLKDVPPMSFAMLHAALRLAAEEAYPVELSEQPKPDTRATHAAAETFSRGPYAHSVAEVKSFMDFLEKLSRDTEMQERLANILAPGVSRAQKIAPQLEERLRGIGKSKEAPGSPPIRAHGQAEAMRYAAFESFRNAARGNLRFQIAVIEAQKTALEALLEESDDDEKRSQIIREYITGFTRKGEDIKLRLEALDKEDLSMRVAAAYSPKREASEARVKAAAVPEIVISRTGLPKLTFSVQSGIFADLEHQIERRVSERTRAAEKAK